MNLDNKSKENIDLTEHCIKANQFFAAVGGRPYYAVFQKIKFLLQKYDFEYKKFLKKIGKQNERNYSHGTISYAVVELMQQCKKNVVFQKNIVYIDNLYNLRRKVDYKDDNISKNEITLAMSLAKSIINDLSIL